MASFPCITNLVPVYNSQENRVSITPVQNQLVRCEVDELLFDMAVDSERKEEFLVLDGGLGTELTRAGFNLDVSQSHNI